MPLSRPQRFSPLTHFPFQVLFLSSQLILSTPRDTIEHLPSPIHCTTLALIGQPTEHFTHHEITCKVFSPFGSFDESFRSTVISFHFSLHCADGPLPKSIKREYRMSHTKKKERRKIMEHFKEGKKMFLNLTMSPGVRSKSHSRASRFLPSRSFLR